MIVQEPTLNVGIISNQAEIRGVLHGDFQIERTDCPAAAERELHVRGSFSVSESGRDLILKTESGESHPVRRGLSLNPEGSATFTLNDVLIGIAFHWERKEAQTFPGGIKFIRSVDGTVTAINCVPLETYLTSVISSEMSAQAPVEFLKAHAIASRSWLAAMLTRQQRPIGAGETVSASGNLDSGYRLSVPAAEIPHAKTAVDCPHETAGARGQDRDLPEINRWYDREEHTLFDVCADDHCQRYQGITKIISPAAATAVAATRGAFLTYDGRICDARYHKACGGITEPACNVWEAVPVGYLTSIVDAHGVFPPADTETAGATWLNSRPDVYCRVTDTELIKRILPDFDQETVDFFRWSVSYNREELQEILFKKAGIAFGTLLDLIPLTRGPSGRISRLKIIGTKQSVTVGKELEIRRWLSRSHLYSSAFVVRAERDRNGVPRRFHLDGGGWGHGVGLCQIGAAAMAARGKTAEQILAHYFPGTALTVLY